MCMSQPTTNQRVLRKSLRGETINYRWGWFFVSFNVAENKSVFGAIAGESVALNELGRRVAGAIADMPRFYPEVKLDEYVVMPNHVHFIIKIEDRPTNDKMHLGRIVRKLKTFTATIYRKMKTAGEISDFGIDGLWQTDFWEVIVTNHDQLEGYRRYIRNNPKKWTRDRFGAVTAHFLGNIALLDRPFVAYVASEGDASAAPQKLWSRTIARGRSFNSDASGTRNAEIGEPTVRPPVISTFTSPSERQFFRKLLSAKRSVIKVYPGGIPTIDELPRDLKLALSENRALLLSPVETGTGLNKQRANWCNEYVLRNATEVWAGPLRPGGSLEALTNALRPRPNL